jgi:hypothetical protein
LIWFSYLVHQMRIYIYIYIYINLHICTCTSLPQSLSETLVTLHSSFIYQFNLCDDMIYTQSIIIVCFI